MLRQSAENHFHLNTFPRAPRLGNSRFQAVFKVQPLSHVAKLLATTANSVFCLCVAFAGSDTSAHTEQWH